MSKPSTYYAVNKYLFHSPFLSDRIVVVNVEIVSINVLYLTKINITIFSYLCDQKSELILASTSD